MSNAWGSGGGYRVVRWLLAVLMLVAAGLKGYQLATEPVSGGGLMDSRWFLMATVEFEIFFGLWLLSGFWPRLTWAAAIACFGLFSVVSLSKALGGAASCGCFGQVQVNPWYTCMLDVAAVAALLRWRPDSIRSAPELSLAALAKQLATVGGVWLLLAIPAAVAMGRYEPAKVAESGEILGDSQFVVLEPEKWIKKPFPLLEHIDVGGRLGKGEWIVLLFHHDCHSCQDAIPAYASLGHRLANDAQPTGVALIEMPPYGNSHGAGLTESSPCINGRLSESREWFVEAPVEIRLSQGIVTSIADRNEVALRRTTSKLAALSSEAVRGVERITAEHVLTVPTKPFFGNGNTDAPGDFVRGM